MLKRNLRALTAVFLIGLIGFSSITLLAKAGRSLRIDLTEGKIYTLSGWTRDTIRSLSYPVKLKLFYSRTEALKGIESLRPYNNYFHYVRDLLREYAGLSEGRIRLEIIDPKRNSREEQEAIQYGLKPLAVTGDDRFFFGAVLTTEFGQEKVIPFLAPERERLLEYDVTEMLFGAAGLAKKKVGLLSSVDLAGRTYSPQVAGALAFPAESVRRVWTVVERLATFYDIIPLAPGAADFRGLDALMVIHPRNVSEPTLAALNRYVLGGGRMAVFQDPLLLADQPAPSARSAYAPEYSSSSLGRLLTPWGIDMAAGAVAAERAQGAGGEKAAAGIRGTHLTLKDKALNRDEEITAGLAEVRVLGAGRLQLKPVAGIKAVPLLQTSDAGYTMAIDEVFSGTGQAGRPAAASEPLVLAVKLTGRFPDAFPERSGAEPAAESKGYPVVLIFSDVDMLSNAVAAGTDATQPAATGNSSLVLNCLETLTGSKTLAGARKQGTLLRPFSLVDAREDAFDGENAIVIRSLKAEIAKAQREIDALGRRVPGEPESLLREEALRNRKRIENRLARAKEDLSYIQHARALLSETLFSRLKIALVLAGPLLVLLVPAGAFALRLGRRLLQPGRRP